MRLAIYKVTVGSLLAGLAAGTAVGGLIGTFFDLGLGIPEDGVPRKELYGFLGALAGIGVVLGLSLGS